MRAMARTDSADLMPVVGLRLLEGRVGSTLLMQLLASAPEVVCDRQYPIGEYRYLSYCVQVATRMGTPFDPERDLAVTEMLFGTADRTGPLPWVASALSVEKLGPRALRALWGACSAGFRERAPSSQWYAEKLACPVEAIVAAEIPLCVVDVIRDPRDVVASMIAFGDRSGPWGFGRTPGETGDDWVAGLVRTFAARIDTMLAPSGGSTLLLRYEDFALNLTATADLLGDILGVHLDADAAAAQRPENHVTTTSIEESIGRWRRDLAPELAEAIWSVLGSRLVVLGYTHD
jgi:Sulfotransferase family